MSKSRTMFAMDQVISAAYHGYVNSNVNLVQASKIFELM